MRIDPPAICTCSGKVGGKQRLPFSGAGDQRGAEGAGDQLEGKIGTPLSAEKMEILAVTCQMQAEAGSQHPQAFSGEERDVLPMFKAVVPPFMERRCRFRQE